MQGRLSPQVNGKIQAFPSEYWRDEFPAAQGLGLGLMEWTLDHDNLTNNPLMSSAGRDEICTLSHACSVFIPSVTGDCFMQAPFWKASVFSDRERLLLEFDAVAHASDELGIGIIVVPVVDNGRIESAEQADILRDGLLARADALAAKSLQVAFESDLPPHELAEWIASYPAAIFGINYDTGNSAALGFNPQEEWSLYGSRVINVHIKDRLLGGTTVPLAEGACDFGACFQAMHGADYEGNLILQTARATDGDHAGAIQKHIAFLQRILNPESSDYSIDKIAIHQ